MSYTGNLILHARSRNDRTFREGKHLKRPRYLLDRTYVVQNHVVFPIQRSDSITPPRRLFPARSALLLSSGQACRFLTVTVTPVDPIDELSSPLPFPNSLSPFLSFFRLATFFLSQSNLRSLSSSLSSHACPWSEETRRTYYRGGTRRTFLINRPTSSPGVMAE